MGFYTYTKNGTGKALAEEFVAWLNEHGVTCDFSGSTFSVSDFNGMPLSLTSAFFSESTTYTHTFTLVTDPGKEMILIQGRQDGTLTVNTRYYKNQLVVNREGALHAFTDVNYGAFTTLYIPWSGSSLEQVNLDTTGDIYVCPLVSRQYVDKAWQNIVFPNYYFTLNKVEVPAGTIISDGTKQFISCGLFLFVEYNPATMRS